MYLILFGRNENLKLLIQRHHSCDALAMSGKHYINAIGKPVRLRKSSSCFIAARQDSMNEG